MRKLQISVFVIMLTGATAFAQPRLESSSSEFDFGLTIHNSIILCHLWLSSTGTDTVEITDIKTGCSCITSPLKTNKIPPGDSMRITIIWDTQKTYGVVNRFPSFFYKGAKEPLVVGITANVLYVPDSGLAATIWPFKFELGRHQTKSIDSLEFRIKNTSDGELIPVLSSEPPDECEIYLPKRIPAKGDARGYVKVKPEFLDKEFESSVTIAINYGKKYNITVPIRRKFYVDKS